MNSKNSCLFGLIFILLVDNHQYCSSFDYTTSRLRIVKVKYATTFMSWKGGFGKENAIITGTLDKKLRVKEKKTPGDTHYVLRLWPMAFASDILADSLIEHGADLPLHVAACHGSIDAIVTLVRGGADVNRRDCNGVAPLCFAVNSRKAEVVEKLITLGADINSVDNCGRSALHLASSQGLLDVVMILATNGAKLTILDSEGVYPVVYALKNQHTDIYVLLVLMNFIFEGSDSSGIEFLPTFCKNVWDFFSLILKQWFFNSSSNEVNQRNFRGFTALSLAVWNEKNTEFDNLIALSADINQIDANGDTALHVASSAGPLEFVIKLLDKGANVNQRNFKGYTPLSYAASNGRFAVVDVLLAHGADVNNVNTKGFTALHWASFNGWSEIVVKLINSRAVVDHPDFNGVTSLGFAASNGHVDVMRILLKFGADINIVDRKGRSPVSIAIANGHLTTAAALLIEQGVTLTGLDNEQLINKAGEMHLLRKGSALMKVLSEGKRNKNKRSVAEAIEMATEKSVEMKAQKNSYVPVFEPPQQVETSAFPSAEQGTALMKIYDRIIALLEGPINHVSWAQLRLEQGFTMDTDADAKEEQEDAMMQNACMAQLSIDNLISNSSQVERDDRYLDSSFQSDDVFTLNEAEELPIVSQLPVDDIQLSEHTLKWLKKCAHDKYKNLFLSRIKDLSEGKRSYTLSKRLKNCVSPIFESKLYGHRILWTSVWRGSKSSILVWCVSTHSDVPRKMKLIDQSISRLARSIATTDSSDFIQLTNDDDVLINPFGNAPLRLFVEGREGLPALASVADWKPPLLLSNTQREINSQTGSVLLLGRSGTGKTKYLVSRMVRDSCSNRQDGSEDDSRNRFRQLFVSRTVGVCELVKSLYKYEQDGCSANHPVDYMTLEQFIMHMDNTVRTKRGASAMTFVKEKRVDFTYFRDNFFPRLKGKRKSMNALVVWTQIRSFIKGSIEAVLLGQPLSLKNYTNLELFGNERCRLSENDRLEAFSIYEQYEAELRSGGMWDDADRVMDVLARCDLKQLQPLSGSVPDECGDKDFDRVYVDEIQDSTQAEICLFFVAAGLQVQSLFLAGDPAQAVVEGVDFRFEEVRSIVYKLSQGRESIDRPMKLFVNYRSHSGILNCASAVLETMLAAFPGSAKVLPPDSGISQGPRPAYYMASGSDDRELRKILGNNGRLVVLCPDEIRESLSSYIDGIALGIRQAKGLEFTDVALVDFFSTIPNSDQKVWKQLLTTDEGQMGQTSWSPQVETQLKMLYTAITRSCNRLIFVERKTSVAGKAFFSWLQTMQLSEPLVTENDGSVGEVMTADDWRARGLSMAFSAEGPSTISLLENALDCFTRANDTTLQARTATQLDARLMIQRLSAGDVVNMSLVEEQQLAKLTEALLENKLVTDAISLCELIGPMSCDPVKYYSSVTSRLQALKSL